jgi:aryl-alcohol dehydrogenase-like predicted oxidoreductase
MNYRKLGYSELSLSTIGLGTWAMGGGNWAFGWGDQDDTASIRAIHKALDLGINWIDTAAVYGLGRAEEVVGKAVQGKREDVMIATKCGRVWDEGRNIGKRLKAWSISQEIDDSLSRLNTDYVDLYQIHWPEPDEDIEEAWEEMAKIVKQGKARYIGVSNFNVDQMSRVQSSCPIASLQPPYSMLRREIEKEILPYCKANDIGVIPYSPMQAGLLTGKFSESRVEALPENDWRSRNPYFQQPQLSVHLEMVDGLSRIALDLGITTAQLSLAWILTRNPVTSAIVGARKPSQIEETVQAVSIELSSEILERLNVLLTEHELKLTSTQPN